MQEDSGPRRESLRQKGIQADGSRVDYERRNGEVRFRPCLWTQDSYRELAALLSSSRSAAARFIGVFNSPSCCRQSQGANLSLRSPGVWLQFLGAWGQPAVWPCLYHL